MPIEFHCPSCNRLLKTPDATAGKKGKCPHCQSVMQIPTSSIADNWPSSPPQPQSAPPPPTPQQPPAPQSAPQPAPQPGPTGGSIEFHCQNCNKLLKTPPQTAGKQGKCPHCGGVMHIPMQSTASAQDSGLSPLGDSSGLSPLGDSSGLSPFGPGSGSAPAGGGVNDLLDDLPALQPMGPADQGNPIGGGATLPGYGPAPTSSNPYASPGMGSGPGPGLGAGPKPKKGKAAAKAKVMGPAIGMIVYAVLAILVSLFAIVMQMVVGTDLPEPQNDAEALGQQVGFAVGFGLFYVLPLFTAAGVIVGAIQMLNLKGYGLAMTACILSVLPCGYCCILGLPFGIWGIVVLNDEKVKRAFG